MHISVFKKEIIETLNVTNGSYADLTLGAGGHSLEIWNKLSAGNLICFDIDLKAIEAFMNKEEFTDQTWEQIQEGIWKLDIGSKKLYLVNKSFDNLKLVIDQLEIPQLSGIIADLGWADEQLEGIEGLSYSRNSDAALDMRLRADMQVKASDLLNGLHERELKQLFSGNADLYGKQLNDLVSAIINFRKSQPIEKVGDLLQIINSERTSATNHGARNLPARVFQALRIAVNHELSTLQFLLEQCLNTLVNGGIISVITFHSGEEKLVAKAFDELVSEARAEHIFAQKYLQPSVAELRENLRARSAKLFALKKL